MWEGAVPVPPATQGSSGEQGAVDDGRSIAESERTLVG